MIVGTGTRRPVVVKQQRRRPVVSDHNIHRAVVVEVGESYSAPDVRLRESASGDRCDIGEPAVVIVVQERVDLLILDFG